MIESSESTYRRYIEQRQEYARTSSEHLTRFERSTLVASGAGIAGVFSIFNNGKMDQSEHLFLASALFAISFAAMLVSHYFSYLDNENAIRALDAKFEGFKEETPERPWYSHWIELLNWASLTTMILGYSVFAFSLMVE